MAPEENHDAWKGVNVNVGLLVALAALFCTAFVAGLGVPAWVDDRVSERLDADLTPTQLELEQHQHRIEALEARVERLENNDG